MQKVVHLVHKKGFWLVWPDFSCTYFVLRCVSTEKCKENNLNKRTVGFFITPAIRAEDATCPGGKTETCCHEANIEQKCSDYNADGYSCQENCLDLSTDLPTEDERQVDKKLHTSSIMESAICEWQCWHGTLIHVTVDRDFEHIVVICKAANTMCQKSKFITKITF